MVNTDSQIQRKLVQSLMKECNVVEDKEIKETRSGFKMMNDIEKKAKRKSQNKSFEYSTYVRNRNKNIELEKETIEKLNELKEQEEFVKKSAERKRYLIEKTEKKRAKRAKRAKRQKRKLNKKNT